MSRLLTIIVPLLMISGFTWMFHSFYGNYTSQFVQRQYLYSHCGEDVCLVTVAKYNGDNVSEVFDPISKVSDSLAASRRAEARAFLHRLESAL